MLLSEHSSVVTLALLAFPNPYTFVWRMKLALYLRAAIDHCEAQHNTSP